MARSKKKIPFVAHHLLGKIEKCNMTKEKEMIRTWSRASTIIPPMIGHTIAIHNGKEHLPVYITDYMVNYKLGDFVPTRTLGERPKNDQKSGRNDKKSGRNDQKSGRNDQKSGRNDQKSGRNDQKSRRNDQKSRR
nr:ribosomal protein S19 [Limnocharis flava]